MMSEQSGSIRWSVTAWTQAPGDFPEPIQQTVTVSAENVVMAVSASAEHFSNLNPTIVRVERIQPPASEVP